jgi:hypothetical protein
MLQNDNVMGGNLFHVAEKQHGCRILGEIAAEGFFR